MTFSYFEETYRRIRPFEIINHDEVLMTSSAKVYFSGTVAELEEALDTL